MFTGVDVPPEILEQILLNLPVKSLLRFSIVSKSWRCMIESRTFVQEHKSLAARERMITIPYQFDHLIGGAAVCKIPLSSSAIEYSSDLMIWPIEGTPHLLAFCDDLWLVEAQKSLFLWNHSMRSCWKLCPSKDYRNSRLFIYGLAYDSAADDYKVLKIVRDGIFCSRKTELYSLKSNSWKTFPSFPVYSRIEQKKCEFVNGAFHWICTRTCVMVSFNLSTEKYGKIALPAIDLDTDDKRWVEVVVMRGKLCVSGNKSRRWCGSRFVLWVMEEYGVEKSWTKKLDIECSHRRFQHRLRPLSFFMWHRMRLLCFVEEHRLRPLCFYDNGDVLFNVSCKKNNVGLFMYKEKGAKLKKIVARDGRLRICRGFIYVESLVSPWRDLPITNANKEGFHKRKRTN